MAEVTSSFSFVLRYLFLNQMNAPLTDKHGKPINDGDWVSLDGNITADDSMGFLPNGWTFDETDVYQVYWDERIKNWSLHLGVEPINAYNCKYLNHAVGLLHDGNVELTAPPQPER